MTQTAAGKLVQGHLGATVTVSHGGTSITGMLARITHEVDLIEDSPWMGDRTGIPSYVSGRSKTVVRIAPDLRLELDPASIVEVAA